MFQHRTLVALVVAGGWDEPVISTLAAVAAGIKPQVTSTVCNLLMRWTKLC
jgi:hypothetical protein